MTLAKGISTFILLFIIYSSYDFPLFGLGVSIFLLFYFFILCYFPKLWLLVLPFCLPVFDLSPYTGRFFFDEFDFLILVTFAHFLWAISEKKTKGYFSKTSVVFICIFCFFYFISFLIGLLPWQPIDINSFSNYYSQFNALRVFKGVGLTLLLLPILKRDYSDNRGKIIFCYGMVLGFFSVCIISIWERYTFPGLFNFTSDFRITSWFSSMHTGGGHIDAYIMLTFPFLAVFFLHKHKLIYKVITVLLFVLGVYVSLVTFSRGVYVGLVIEIMIMISLLYLHYKPKDLSKALLYVLAVMVIVFVSSFSVFKGEFINKRIQNISKDYEVRLFHWQDAVSMMSDDMLTTFLGMGLGSYPRTYFWSNSEGVTPATNLIIEEGDRRFLRLGKGDPLYMGQYVTIQSQHRYILKYEQRTKSGAQLSIPVCEKSLLYSMECTWLGDNKTLNDNKWHSFEIGFNSGNLGEERGVFKSKRPIQVALNYSGGQGYLDVDNIELIDEFGQNIISNGSFEEGVDRWFFSTENHLPWHIKNLWVHIYFDQGAIGLLTFSFLVFFAFFNLKARFLKGDSFTIILISSLSGFFIVSVVASPFDAPRLTFLFFMLLFFSLEKIKKV